MIRGQCWPPRWTETTALSWASPRPRAGDRSGDQAMGPRVDGVRDGAGGVGNQGDVRGDADRRTVHAVPFVVWPKPQ